MPNCKILKYYEIDKVAWQMLIKQSSYATWFQTPEAYNFYESVHNEMTPFAYGVERRGELCAVCVGYITKEKNIIKQFFTRRAIIIGGPVIADNAEEQDVEQLLRAMIVALTSQAIYIETRNFNDYSKWKNVFKECGFSYQPHLNVQVTCDAAHAMSEQRRRQVKKAISNAATICEAQTEQEIRDWYSILQHLYRKKVRTPLFSEEFFLEFYRKKIGKYLLVKYEDKVIGGMMCPVLEGKAIYEWYICGLDEEYHEQYPSVMATYAAIEYAKKHHIPLFDFMGAGKPNEAYGVRDFKMEFGGESVEYGRFLFVGKQILYRIGKLAVQWLKGR